MLKKLVVLNGAAAVLAVLHHSTHWALTGMLWWADRYSAASVPDLTQVGSLNYWLLRGLDQVASGAVFAFLFIAGYSISLTTAAESPGAGWRVILGRLKLLLPPYLIWSIVMMLNGWLQGQTYAPVDVFRLLLTGGAAPPYYFVPLVIQLYLLSPWLLRAARSRAKTLMAAALAVQLVSISLVYVLLFAGAPAVIERLMRAILDWHLPAYAPWFILGLVAGSHRSEFTSFLMAVRRRLAWSLLPAFVAGMTEWNLVRSAAGRTWLSPQELLFDTLFYYMLLLVLLAFEAGPRAIAPGLSRIGPRAYGIYLSHILVIEVAARAAYHFAPWLLALPVPFVVTLTVLGTGIPFLIMTVLRRATPGRVVAWAFG
jgi:surface polysaccharide O-acyltransferase-like enzyme